MQNTVTDYNPEFCGSLPLQPGLMLASASMEQRFGTGPADMVSLSISSFTDAIDPKEMENKLRQPGGKNISELILCLFLQQYLNRMPLVNEKGTGKRAWLIREAHENISE